MSFYGGLNFDDTDARISIIDLKKELKYSNSVPYTKNFKNPNSWICSCIKLLESLPLEIKSKLVNLAISGSSGTLIALDLKGDPIGEAITYYPDYKKNNELLEPISIGINQLQTTKSTLSKALILIDKYGENILLRLLSDWITGWFLKDWTYGEAETNLTLGWDLIKESWPTNYLNNSWHKCLPLIIKSGRIMGQIDYGLAKRLKLNEKLLIISGTTEPNAALLASGLDKEEGLTVLGSRIVMKKINNEPVIGEGIINHRVCRDWICEGETNAGYEILSQFFSDQEIKEISRQINTSKETTLNLFPLNSRGSIFPITNPFLEPILNPRPVSDALYLHALLEGLARIELKGWEKLYELTGSLPKRIITIGKGSNNPQWRKIREQIINIPIISCKKSTSFGAALLAIRAKK